MISYIVICLYVHAWQKGPGGDFPDNGMVGSGQLVPWNGLEMMPRIEDIVSVSSFWPQAQRFWLKLLAEENMEKILVTEETSHDEMSWLKLVAFVNIPDISVTEPTSHDERSWLNEDASPNMADM